MTSPVHLGAAYDPYVGPRPFESGDSGRFFGRERESHEVADLWHAERVTVLYGPQGSGKTSLIQAGVLPLLQPGKADVLPVGRVTYRANFPLASLPDHNPHILALLSSWCPDDDPARLAGLSLPVYLRRRTPRLDIYGDPVPILMAIDQAEELFTSSPSDRPYREWFIEQVVQILNEESNLRLLISIREGHLGAILSPESKLGGIGHRAYPLGLLSAQAAVRAITEPVRNSRRTFDPAASGALVQALMEAKPLGHTGGQNANVVDPGLLQAACSTLWHALPDDVVVITSEHVRRHADVRTTLTDYLEQALEEVAHDHNNDDRASLLDWLKENLIDPTGRHRSRSRLDPHTMAGVSEAALRALADRQIVRIHGAEPERWCELVHDRLIKPILRARDESTMKADMSAEEYLRAAERALTEGNTAMAVRNAEQAAMRTGEGERLAAEVDSFFGNIEYLRGEYDKALAHYRAAAQGFELNGDIGAVGRLLSAIAGILILQAKPGRAIEELQSALRRIPGDVTIETTLGRALWQSGDQEGAMRLLDGVLSREGGAPEALRIRGEILAYSGDPAEALNDFDRISPLQSPSARAARALALARQGRLEEAERELVEARGEAENNVLVLMYGSLVEELLGNAEVAATLAERAKNATLPSLPPHLRVEAERLGPADDRSLS